MEIKENDILDMSNKDWSEYAQYCNENGLVLVNIKDSLFKVEKSILGVDMTELNSLKDWFDNDYTRKEQKYNRLIRKSLLTDDNKDPQQLLSELDEEAEQKRKRIQELENLLKVE